MSLAYQQKVHRIIFDYKLWIASIEQYLEDNHIYQNEIFIQLKKINSQLSSIIPSHPISHITNQLLSIETSLNQIQLHIKQYSFQLS